MRNAPDFVPNTDRVVPKLMAAAKLRVTWQMSILYAIVFGGFVAFSNYLPTYLKTIYEFSAIDAGARTAGFAIAAVLARPIGGSFRTGFHPKFVVMISFAGTAAMAFVAVFQPPPDVWSAASFITMAVLPGYRHWRCVRLGGPARAGQAVGSVTGIVGAAGGLGGFFPPLVMGATYDSADNDYTIGLLLLSLTCLVALAYTAWRSACARARSSRRASR